MRGQLDRAQHLPGAEAVRAVAGHQVDATLCRRSPPSGVQMTASPSRPEASETIDAAQNDWQTLPPTVAVFQILNEASSAFAATGNDGCRRPVRRHVDRPATLGEGDERRDRAGRADAQARRR